MKGFPVTLEVPVLWGDMDALRHVNNARYFVWFESARIGYFDRVRASLPALRSGAPPGAAELRPRTPAGAGTGLGEVGPVVASTSCDFLRPVVYPGTVLVGAKVLEIGNSSLRMEYAVARASAPLETCARGTSVVVLVRYATLEKVRVPDEMRAAITAMEKAAG